MPPRWVVCCCGEHGTVSVQGVGERSRVFGAGSVVDLNEVVVPATEQAPAQTMGDALERYLSLFKDQAPSAHEAPPIIRDFPAEE